MASLPASTSIVFDTNVLISAFIFKKSTVEVYQFCAERYSLYTSEWMLAELTEILSKTKFKLPVSLQEDILSQVKADAQLVYPTNELPTDSRDPDDNNVLQVALFINADFVITGDGDLLDLGTIGNTEIINPKTFFDRYVA